MMMMIVAFKKTHRIPSVLCLSLVSSDLSVWIYFATFLKRWGHNHTGFHEGYLGKYKCLTHGQVGYMWTLHIASVSSANSPTGVSAKGL